MLYPGSRRLRRPARWAAVLGLAGPLLVACQGPPSPVEPPTPAETPAYACPPGHLLIEGPDGDKALFEELITDYSEACRNAGRIDLSTARDSGNTSFVNGLVHIAASDIPLSPEQVTAGESRCLGNPVWHLPVSAEPVSLVHQVEGVPDLTLGPQTLAKIFTGIITEWDDPEIVAANPEADLPAERIQVFARAGRSGATEAVTGYLAATAPDYWPVRNSSPVWRGQGQTLESAERVAAMVRATPNSLGYVEASGLEAGAETPQPLATVTIDQNGRRITPSTTATTTAMAGARTRTEGHDMRIDSASLVQVEGGYPIIRVGYQIVCSAGLSPEITALETDWLRYLTDPGRAPDASQHSRQPLPDPWPTRQRDAISAIR